MREGTILIIDDEEGIRDVLQLSLEEEGYKTISATNGAEALELLQKISPPDLILLDLMMPIMDGEEFLVALNNDERLQNLHIPIVLITAFNQTELKGISSVLHKPMDLDSLLSTAHEYCG